MYPGLTRVLLLPIKCQPDISLAYPTARRAGRRVRPDEENGFVEMRIMTILYVIFDI